MHRRICLLILILFTAAASAALATGLTAPVISGQVVFEERDGLVAVEAEHLYKQTQAETRAWYRVSRDETPDAAMRDVDGKHLAGASNGAYLEILPDTRSNHDEELIRGTNFSNEPGVMAIAHYKVRINTPGRYYVWVRAHSTGSEDNGVHVGLNGEWPASGQRLQWCDGKNTWRWESRQRTEEEHCGVPGQIYLDIDEPGIHEIQFSMREDGFEMDKFLLTMDAQFGRPEGAGPAVRTVGDAELPVYPAVGVAARGESGDGTVAISGELRTWHKATLTLDGPFAHERDTAPNPFTDYNMMVRFRHESGKPDYTVPGYFAADGRAGETSADSGTKWRAHLSPDKPGQWTYEVSFVTGEQAALGGADVRPLAPYHGRSGEFTIQKTDKQGRDFRAKGRLEYAGQRYLRFAESGEYFFKAGADAPETFLAYVDFDGTVAMKDNVPLKTWTPHLEDWREGDPTWKDHKGKGIIGAVNYMAGKGANAISFLTYNQGGDGDNVWPFAERNAKRHYDCSKLDQWAVVIEHMQHRGVYAHFKLQETEIDDNRDRSREENHVEAALDGGALGPERKLYLREIIARFGHNLALNWNLGEENTQTPEEQRAMAEFIHQTDPYGHHIVIHTYPGEQEQVYEKLIGGQSKLTGASLQNGWDNTHKRTLKWVRESGATGRQWVVANDEQGSASEGVPPDPGYEGFEGIGHDLHDVRKQVLWGNLMAGGAGVEYYFGYRLPQNDLICEDYASRDRSWDYCRIATEFFDRSGLPFVEMDNRNDLIGNPDNGRGKYCLAKPGEVYLVYLGYVPTAELDLSGQSGRFTVRWFNPRAGGEYRAGSVESVRGGGAVGLGDAPADSEEDWLVIVSR